MRNEGVFIGGRAFDITSHYARSACHSMVGQGGAGACPGALGAVPCKVSELLSLHVCVSAVSLFPAAQMWHIKT